jgi:glycosyltransferase involved in cell wall biosynthesis
MFSVVIPLYNKAHTIEKTLNSVLNQTFTEFEVIIVNDGSTDNGVQIISNITDDQRIRIIEQENQGVSAARNRGVAESKYNYIAFLDGDDGWMPTFLEKIKEAIEMYPEAGMFGSSSLHHDFITGEEFDSTLLRYKDRIQKVNYFENPGTLSHTSATVVSKKIFNNININGEGFPVGMKCCEDWSCFFRIAFLSPVVYLGFPLGIRNNNIEGQITGISKDERFKLLLYVTNYYNLTFKSWFESKERNMLYPIYLKYDIRHRILSALRIKDYRTSEYILNSLDRNILRLFLNLELIMYRERKLRLLSIIYIYYTKVIWRRHGFPIAGKN